MPHPIRVGVGGWVYEPWNETFYPPGLPKTRHLAFAASKLTAIEINATFYRTQTPDTFRKWAAETPDGFQFAVKAHRFCTSRKTAADMQAAIANFIGSGVSELGDRLGPINWQFPPTRTFDRAYFEAFCGALPAEHKGVPLRHAIEVRHPSFTTEAFDDILRKHACACVSADGEDWPQPDRPTAPFAYARLQNAIPDEPTGYAPEALAEVAKTLKAWAKTRTVYAFFIAGAKERDPAAAQSLIARL